MDRLGKLATSLWTILFIVGGLFMGLLIWGVSFMGDPLYPLEIQNDKLTNLKLKTYKLTFNTSSKELTVDSLELKPKEKLYLGTIHSCSTIDPADIDFEAIEIFDEYNHPNLLKRKDIVDFLATKERIDCATYIVR
jgi:hypothetical protein